MAIGRIERISNTTPSTAVSNVTSTTKNLQNQLLMKQQNLKKLSSDSSLSVDEQEKQRQELQKEIEELKRKLEQMRLKQEEEKKAEAAEEKKEIDLEKVTESQKEKEENNTFAVEQNEDHKKEVAELSADEVQKMMDTNLFLKEELVQQGVEYDQKNLVRVISGEVKQDELRGLDTAKKEEEMEDILDKQKFWIDAKNKEQKQEEPTIVHPDMQVVLE